MHKTSTTLASLLLLAACSAAARTGEVAAADADSSVPPAMAQAAAPAPAPVMAAAQAPPAAIAPIAAPAAAVHTTVGEAQAAVDALSCDVRTRRTANGVLVTANVFSQSDLSGEYEMVITKSGGGNDADINQAGPFSVRAGASTALGETEIGLDRNARLRVTLRLTSDDGQTCSRTFRL